MASLANDPPAAFHRALSPTGALSPEALPTLAAKMFVTYLRLPRLKYFPLKELAAAARFSRRRLPDIYAGRATLAKLRRNACEALSPICFFRTPALVWPTGP
jgi:hypothetical protein